MVKFRRDPYINYDNEEDRVILYDIQGNVIKDFGAAYSIFINSHLHKIDNHYRLLLQRTTYDADRNRITNTEIYSVPDAPTSNNVSALSASKNQSPYPNPTNSTITLPYQLKQGETSEMRIFNMNGQLIETKKVDSMFDKIVLNVSQYSKGVYIYEVNSISSNFIMN